MEVWVAGEPNEAAIFLPKKHFLIRQNFHLQLLSSLRQSAVGSLRGRVLPGSCVSLWEGLGRGTFWNLTLFHTYQSLLYPCQPETNRQQLELETANYAPGAQLKTNFLSVCCRVPSDSSEVATPRTHLTEDSAAPSESSFKCVGVKWSQLIKQILPGTASPDVPLLYFIWHFLYLFFSFLHFFSATKNDTTARKWNRVGRWASGWVGACAKGGVSAHWAS